MYSQLKASPIFIPAFILANLPMLKIVSSVFPVRFLFILAAHYSLYRAYRPHSLRRVQVKAAVLFTIDAIAYLLGYPLPIGLIISKPIFTLALGLAWLKTNALAILHFIGLYIVLYPLKAGIMLCLTVFYYFLLRGLRFLNRVTSRLTAVAFMSLTYYGLHYCTYWLPYLSHLLFKAEDPMNFFNFLWSWGSVFSVFFITSLTFIWRAVLWTLPWLLHGTLLCALSVVPVLEVLLYQALPVLTGCLVFLGRVIDSILPTPSGNSRVFAFATQAILATEIDITVLIAADLVILLLLYLMIASFVEAKRYPARFAHFPSLFNMYIPPDTSKFKMTMFACGFVAFIGFRYWCGVLPTLSNLPTYLLRMGMVLVDVAACFTIQPFVNALATYVRGYAVARPTPMPTLSHLPHRTVDNYATRDALAETVAARQRKDVGGENAPIPSSPSSSLSSSSSPLLPPYVSLEGVEDADVAKIRASFEMHESISIRGPGRTFLLCMAAPAVLCFFLVIVAHPFISLPFFMSLVFSRVCITFVNGITAFLVNTYSPLGKATLPWRTEMFANRFVVLPVQRLTSLFQLTRLNHPDPKGRMLSERMRYVITAADTSTLLLPIRPVISTVLLAIAQHLRFQSGLPASAAQTTVPSFAGKNKSSSSSSTSSTSASSPSSSIISVLPTAALSTLEDAALAAHLSKTPVSTSSLGGLVASFTPAILSGHSGVAVAATAFLPQEEAVAKGRLATHDNCLGYGFWTSAMHFATKPVMEAVNFHLPLNRVWQFIAFCFVVLALPDLLDLSGVTMMSLLGLGNVSESAIVENLASSSSASSSASSSSLSSASLIRALAISRTPFPFNLIHSSHIVVYITFLALDVVRLTSFVLVLCLSFAYLGRGIALFAALRPLPTSPPAQECAKAALSQDYTNMRAAAARWKDAIFSPETPLRASTIGAKASPMAQPPAFLELLTSSKARRLLWRFMFAARNDTTLNEAQGWPASLTKVIENNAAFKRALSESSKVQEAQRSAVKEQARVAMLANIDESKRTGCPRSLLLDPQDVYRYLKADADTTMMCRPMRGPDMLEYLQTSIFTGSQLKEVDIAEAFRARKVEALSPPFLRKLRQNLEFDAAASAACDGLAAALREQGIVPDPSMVNGGVYETLTTEYFYPTSFSFVNTLRSWTTKVTKRMGLPSYLPSLLLAWAAIALLLPLLRSLPFAVVQEAASMERLLRTIESETLVEVFWDMINTICYVFRCFWHWYLNY